MWGIKFNRDKTTVTKMVLKDTCNILQVVQTA